MRILMVLEGEFPPDIRVENEIKSLLKAGHEVDIACYTRKNKLSKDKYLTANIIRKAIPKFIYKSSIGMLDFPFYFNFWRKFIDKCLQDKKYDAIHIHDLPLAKLAYSFKGKYGVKFVLDLHENYPVLLDISAHTKTFLGKLFFSYNKWVIYEKKYTSLADKVIVVIEEAKDRLIKLGVQSEKISIVRNTLNIDIFDSRKEDGKDGDVILVYGGGVNYHRGLQDVIKALAKIEEKDNIFKLWIVGAGSYLNNLKQLVEELSIKDRVVFHGWKKQDELFDLINKGDIALIPHVKSGHSDNTIPHKIFQYMYARLPIISSNCDPLERIIKETNSGIVFKSGDTESLYCVLNDIIKDKSILDNYKNSKHWVEEKYNWEVDSKVLIELYKENE